MSNKIDSGGCRRCGGDLFLDRDEDGEFLYCLQCGGLYAAPPQPGATAPAQKAPAVQSSAGPAALSSRSRSQRLISSRAGGAT
jgi:hypothetical protein